MCTLYQIGISSLRGRIPPWIQSLIYYKPENPLGNQIFSSSVFFNHQVLVFLSFYLFIYLCIHLFIFLLQMAKKLVGK